jgi:hypothetical protein
MPRSNDAPRLAVLLLAVAARRWPADIREQFHREWLAELHALITDPDIGRWARDRQALRFSASLAVRRPAPCTVSMVPVVATPRPARELFGAAIGVAIFGTLSAMLLVHLPAAVVDRLPDADSDDALHRLPLMALVPVLAAVGVLAGRRLARRDALTGVTRILAIILIGWCCARLLPMFGGLVTALPGLLLWAIGLWAAARMIARLAARPRGLLPWIAVAVGVLALADLAVISAVWLGVDAAEAPRAYALSWFPGVLLDPAVVLPMGTDTVGDPVNSVILDAVEFLPHGLIVTSAFTLAYIHTAAARSIAPGTPVPQPV